VRHYSTLESRGLHPDWMEASLFVLRYRGNVPPIILGMRKIFALGAWLFIFTGVAMLGIVAVSGNSEMGFVLGLGITGATFVVVGVIWMMIAKFIGNLDPAKILGQTGGTSGLGANGNADPPIMGTALVTSVQDTGMVLNGVNLVVKVGLQVTLAGQAPYDAETRFVAQGRTQWGALQPGMTVGVLVNRNDLSKVVINTGEASAMAPEVPDVAGILQHAGLGGLAESFMRIDQTGQSAVVQSPVAPVPGVRPVVQAGGQQFQATVKSAADIIAQGTQGFGTLELITPTGMSAGQAKAGLPAEEADDPVMMVVFTYQAGGRSMRSQIMVRVPDSKGDTLIVGASIPIVYLPDNPETATIDWSRA